DSIAYTTWRTLDPEIHLAPVAGGPAPPPPPRGATDARGRRPHRRRTVRERTRRHRPRPRRTAA
ncbi:hypothetical protein, partial [Streptomyces durocortorensis]